MKVSIESTDKELFDVFCLSGKFPAVALPSGGVLPIYHAWLDSIGMTTCHTTSKRLSAVMRKSPFIVRIEKFTNDGESARLRYRLNGKAMNVALDAINGNVI